MAYISYIIQVFRIERCLNFIGFVTGQLYFYSNKSKWLWR